MSYLKLKTNTGFTLIETLVAIAILMVAIGTALTLVPSGLSAGRYARNQITASYLAQEGMEIVRNNRDNAMFYIRPRGAETLTWLSYGNYPLKNCLGPETPCGVNGYTDIDTIYPCDPAGCPPLKYLETPEDETVFGDGQAFIGRPESIFTREFRLYKNTNNPTNGIDPINDVSEVAVVVTVTWKETGGREKSVSVKSDLLNWWQ